VIAALVATGTAVASDKVPRLLEVGYAQVGVTRYYDPAYVRLAFPGGDVDSERGVCSDVIVRAFRAVDVDLQQEVNRDMRANFAAYPKIWGLRKPDSNIDHRRVPNLETWFRRQGKALRPGLDAKNYTAGDVVSWRLETGQPHIGLVTDRRSRDGRRPLILHNIGDGARVEDVLFQWRPIGHFRYFPAPAQPPR
jgi:uncharacterized protein YijF (DUF1287 family)